MIGAIIGDLAAWTWEHDRECFYTKLVSDKAQLSGYGLLAIALYDTIATGVAVDKNHIYPFIGETLTHVPQGCDIPEEWNRWGAYGYSDGIPFDLKIALITAAFVDNGFFPNQYDWVHLFHGGKQESYAGHIMTIIHRLRQGATKDEAIANIPDCVINYYPSGHGHKWKDYLTYITFAWRCFYYSFDFTSALHNAMKCTGNRRLAAFITGAFAEAMYGNLYAMTKKKYGGLTNAPIDFPHTLSDAMRQKLREIRNDEFKYRIFFAKNDALSNVERHVWTTVTNPYSEFVVCEELKRRLMKAYHTGYECRYGVYLDNGWFYIYRSHCLLYRFQLVPIEAGWRIACLQKSNDPHGQLKDVGEVLSLLQDSWYVNGSAFPYAVSDEYE